MKLGYSANRLQQLYLLKSYPINPIQINPLMFVVNTRVPGATVHSYIVAVTQNESR